MEYILEENEMYNFIIKDFNISNSLLDQIKDEIYKLVKARMEICELLKIKMITKENLEQSLLMNEKKIMLNIKMYEFNIKNYESKQKELVKNIKAFKQKIKIVKLQINKFEENIEKEKQKNRGLRESLNIFISREKFKTIKKIFFKKYRKVFLKYSNQLDIEKKILECNETKEKIRKEEDKLNTIIKSYTKKINIDKKSIAVAKKQSTNMIKAIEFSKLNLCSIINYRKIEIRFCEKVTS